MGNIIAVFAFEWKRALTWARLSWWLVLAAFPIFIVGLVRYAVPGTTDLESDAWRNLCAWLLFALVPMLISMLGTLLWTTPAISAELERRSWVYLAVRPNGSTAVLLGKYVAAVTWVIPPAILGLVVAARISGTSDWVRIGWTMFYLVLLSCPAYAAIYLLLGVLFPRRAMVLAVAYTLLFELVVSFIPAVINQLTIQYRLRALAAKWCELDILRRQEAGGLPIVGEEPTWLHVTVLIGATFALLIASVAALRMKEFSSSAESDI
ncbi:ABC transporter permease [Schlesneria paludicola]|uniref:ABC transporter permease n=1 Tax=Schlesneria paludicola TaxID=360056 RepID=UPI00029B3FC6|nr:hypothetical protein [Schlesneria paludicola]